ncbi:unnamed protein product [Dibothriocephalus latus]|uniref:SEC7 domain-containing protein n=1 Tax=Dibothriocephalus latus TaxID=60516 RepID=A0A3P6RDU7_DIBLA|nr:unnamed protein product [Dibothriocephalus latus]
MENHPPSAFDSVLSRPPSCSGLSEHRHHPELQRVGAKNWTPSQGIDYLIKAGVISNNPGAIAQFLTGPDLSCQAIGEYFGRLSDPLAVKVTK